jgi:plastocyanin
VPSGDLAIDVAEINGPFSFYPSPAMAAAGQIIVWRNTDAVAHRVVFDDIAVDTGTLAPGTLSQPVTVTQGTWNYHCSIHPEMVGSVTVAAATK